MPNLVVVKDKKIIVIRSFKNIVWPFNVIRSFKNYCIMVEISTKANGLAFIEVVVQQWCAKLGKARLARLICTMSLALNRDSKKRSVPDFQKSFDSIEVDENNVFTLNLKVMKAFFFFVGENLEVFSENVIEQRINANLENNAGPSIRTTPSVYSQI